MFPSRDNDSHKGDNGRVCVIGGSIDYYGAPIFAAMGAVYSGADLVYMFVPESNFDCSRSFYPDYIVRKFSGDFLTEKDLEKIINLANKCDSVVVGPGLGDKAETLKALIKLIAKIEKPLIIDADALKVIHNVKLPYQTLITPHRGEFEKVCNAQFPNDLDHQIELVKKTAQILDLQILVKGQNDIICKPDEEYFINNTGNPGMTVGGSGDVLAGFIAGLNAQGATLFESACIASFCLGVAGDSLESQKGFAYSATDLALEIPYVMKRIVG
ncbi:NAD(P)H-hydrate dehydratase [Candidatus Peregrinibacteria bacterium RIFOXYB2_FULL_32_7]|nr:MAG: NAD(P)H-hydrate dehydratase [Candidatus Peregrinibacteria bacterium RIFOXYB2_FULL_32_7]